MRPALVAILVALLGGCGHQDVWDMSEPWAADYDQVLRWTIATEVRPDFELAVESFGGRVQDGAAQLVHFKEASDCTGAEAGYVHAWDPGTIYLCPPVLTDLQLLRFVVLHEFGHLLKQTSHLPCGSGGVMAPYASCTRQPNGVIAQVYQAPDRPWICSAGGVINARCS